MFPKKHNSIILVKLAGIGDIAMTCRAIENTFARSNDDVTIHWIIDSGLSELPNSILNYPNIKIITHKIRSNKLFGLSIIKKTLEALKLSKVILNIQPKCIALLHRDTRYLFFIRPFFLGKLFNIKSKNIHEVDLYTEALLQCSSHLKLKIDDTTKAFVNEFPIRTNSIGILLGGGRGTKTNFLEKRWPHTFELIKLILDRTDKNIILFGSDEDLNHDFELKKYLIQNSVRINNLVGKTKLNELFKIFQNIDCFISPDSGLAHIAALAMKHSHQKIISLFGPTNPTNWKPVNHSNNITTIYKQLTCSPCYLNDGNFMPCKFHGNEFQQCMKNISANEIFSLINKN